MTTIGIDLGTTNSLAVAFRDGKPCLIPNEFGEFLTPSIVHLSENTLTVGKIAKERLVTDPKNTVQLFKRQMGSDHTFSLGTKKYSASDLSAFVVKQLIADAERFLGEKVDEAVISVPAYFNEHQRYATKAIGDLLGIKVERLINEPSAAAIACHDFSSYKTFIVFDFGGGTLDVSVVDCFENVISICSIAGDNFLGGSDFDKALANHFCLTHNLIFDHLSHQAQASLLLSAERCKLQLQTKDEAQMSLLVSKEILGLKINKATFEQLMLPILEKVKKIIGRAVAESGFTAQDFSALILVGGSSLMPLVQNFLTKTLAIPIKHLPGRDELVALGLGTYIGIKNRDETVKNLIVTDVCPFSLGILTYDEDTQRDYFSKLIEKNTVLPTSASSYFHTIRLGQKKIDVLIYQGESLSPSANLFLGKIEVSIPVNHKKHEAIKVTFSYDINSLLYVEILVVSTGQVIIYRLNQNKSLEKLTKSQHLEEIKSISLELTAEPAYQSSLALAHRIYEEISYDYQLMLEKDIHSFIQSYQASFNNLKKKQSLVKEFEERLLIYQKISSGLGLDIFREWGEDDE